MIRVKMSQLILYYSNYFLRNCREVSWSLESIACVHQWRQKRSFVVSSTLSEDTIGHTGMGCFQTISKNLTKKSSSLIGTIYKKTTKEKLTWPLSSCQLSVTVWEVFAHGINFHEIFTRSTRMRAIFMWTTAARSTVHEFNWTCDQLSRNQLHQLTWC